MSFGSYLIPATALTGITFVVLLWNRARNQTHPPFPPGPKPHLILGNLLDLPTKQRYHAFSQLQKTYGDMIYMGFLGKSLLVINSFEVAKDLMVKRGSNYSGRAGSVMNGEVMDWNWTLAHAQPGPSHTEGRAIFKKSLGQQEVGAYYNVIQEECHGLLAAMDTFQGDPWPRLRETVGAVILKIAYGENIYREHGKQLNDLNEEAFNSGARAAGRLWIVNFLPSLQYLPDWLPLPFKREGVKGRTFSRRLRYWAWQETVKQYNEGRASPSLAVDYLEKGGNLDLVRDVIALTFGAGVDNVAGTLMVFISTMLIHQDVQRKAQAELDAGIEGDDLIDFEERTRFPYFHAAWRESARMNPTTPLCPPHLSAEGDVYRGMYIPKGTVLLANIGFMLRDPGVWDDAEVYKPERWLPEHNPSAALLPSIDDIVFGFGRRICPGELFANKIGFTFAAALLKNFHILPPDGEDIPKEIKFQDSFTRHPEGMRCRFVPRSV